ncbi:transmembrane protein 192-like [Styela clava]
MSQPSTSDTSHLLTVGDFGHGVDSTLVQDQNSSFKPLRTVFLVIFQIFLNAVLLTESIFYLDFTKYCKNQTNTVNNFTSEDFIGNVQSVFQRDCNSIVIFSIILVWIFTWFLQLGFKSFHRQHRSSGYLKLHSQINHITDIPMTVMTIGNAILLIAVTLKMDQLVFTNGKIFSKPIFSFVLQIIAGLEFVIIFISLIIYAVKVIKFNKSRAMPDVFNENYVSSMPTIFNARRAVTVGPGVRDQDKEVTMLQSVCEQQANLIEYLRHRCNVLSGRLHQVTASNVHV